MVGLAVLGGSCAGPSPDTGEDVGQARQASLANMTWVVPPVIQQTHTINGWSDFSVVYVAAGGGCSNTTVPCVKSAHKLWVSPHGQNSFSLAETLPAYNGSTGDGYLLSDVHMGDGSIDCQKPGSDGLCGKSTTYYDLGPGLTPLESYFPPWKVLKASNLSPDTVYDWKVTIDGDANDNPLDSSTLNLGRIKTPPASSGTHSGNFTFVFNSDPQQDTPLDPDTSQEQGGGDAFRDTILKAVMLYAQPDFMLGGGDLTVNGGGMKLGKHWFYDTDTSWWPSLPTVALSTIPMFTAFGNHEWMASGSLDHFDCCSGNFGGPMNRLWNYTPTAAMMYGYTTGGLATLTSNYVGNVQDPYVPYYSFDWGNSHFIVLSTGPDGGNDLGPANGSPPVWAQTGNVGIDKKQLDWLQADLNTHVKGTGTTKHIFVAMHDPIFHPYGDSGFPVGYSQPFPCPPNVGVVGGGPTCSPRSSIGPNRQDTYEYSVDQLVNLFTSFNVDIVLGGHVHTYSRVINGGVNYVTAGIAGGGLDDVTRKFSNAAQVNKNYSKGDGGAIQFPNTDGYHAAQSHSNWPGYEKMFWGYVTVSVDDTNDVVTANAISVLPGYTGTSITTPTLPAQSALTTVDTFTVGASPPTNFNIIVHGNTSSSTGGSAELDYNVNSSVSGTTQLYVSLDGTSFIHQSAFDVSFPGSGPGQILFPMTPGQQAWFYLVNATSAGTSRSPTRSFVFPACQMPGNITTLYNSSGPGGPINVSWPSGYTCPGATFQSYAVQRMDTNVLHNFGTWNTIATITNINTLNYSDTGYPCTSLATGAPPSYRVIAQTTIGGNQVPSLPNANAPSAVYGWSSPDATHCTLTEVTAVQTTPGGGNELDWNNNGQAFTGPITVNRYFGSTCAGTASSFSVAGSATQFIDTTARRGSTYCYVLTDPNGNRSNPALITLGPSYAPTTMTATAGQSHVDLTWSFPSTSLATATTIYRYLAAWAPYPTMWTPVVTIDNPQPNGSVNTWTDHDEILSQWYGPANSGDTTWYYAAVGHAYTPTVDPNTYALTSADNASASGPTASATPVNSVICAGGATPDTVFSPGMAACGGAVTWDQRNTLCGPGYTACTAAQWTANYGGVAPTNDYWTNDNLGYGGSGTNNCEATTTSEGNCGTNDPMRVCGAATDAYGNHCNWTGCGLNTTTNQYFGGCSGNTTAGTMCCLANATTECQPYTNPATGLLVPPQYFAPGVVGCPGKTTWDQRNSLCGQGCMACSASTFETYRSGIVPGYDYWTNDNLTYSGSGPNACGAYTSGGSACGTNTPMRVCVPGTTTDPLGNVCNWYGCGFNANTPLAPSQYLGGCAGNTTAGTVCCCNQ